MKDIKDDPRVVELAKIAVFVVNNYPNKIVGLAGPNFADTITTLHGWCEKALTDAGYVVTKPKPKAKKRVKK